MTNSEGVDAGGSERLVDFEYEKVIEEEDRLEPQRRKRLRQHAPRQSPANSGEGDNISAYEETIRLAEERTWQLARVLSTAT